MPLAASIIHHDQAQVLLQLGVCRKSAIHPPSSHLTLVQKTAPKQDPVAKKSPEPTPPQSSQSHTRQTSKDSICDNSPFISRRPLDAHTDQELRLACRLILQDFKPSDYGMENTDPKLDFGAMQRRKESRAQAADVRVRVPTGAPADLTNTSVGRKPSKTRTRAKADQEIRARTQGDVPARANSSRKRADFAWLDERDDKREEKLKTYGKSPSIDLPRSAALPSHSDEDITLPVTVASTLAHSKVASTAPTSASLPSGGNSNRRSRQLDNPAAVADAQAAEWMRQELEKKNKADALQPQTQSTAAVRLPSRSTSIKDKINGYVFPTARSRTLSRATSKASLRTASTDDDQNLQRNGSQSRFRTWGLPLRSGSKSRPGSSKGPVEDSADPAHADSHTVNLNRELPPLPGLDQWKEPEQPKKEMALSPRSPIAGTHIASLMRPQELLQPPSPTTHKGHRKSGSDTLAMQYAHAYPVRGSSRNPPDIPLSPRRAPPDIPLSPRRAPPDVPLSPRRAPPDIPTSPHRKFTPDSPHNHFDQAVTGCSSHTNLDRRLDPSSSNHTRQRSGDSYPTSQGNFSRKTSLDNTAHTTVSNDPKPTKKEEQKSRLKKVFSGWMTRKSKKDDWMDKIERDGVVKEGVLVQEGTTVSPVVRY